MYYVDLEGDRAIVIYDPTRINLGLLKEAVVNAGYQVGALKEEN